MQRKEYSVSAIEASGGFLEFLDAEGNPFTPEEPLHYQIIGADGSVLKEGELQGDHRISIEDVKSKQFRVVVESHFVAETKGFEPLEEEADSPVEENEHPIVPGDLLEEFEDTGEATGEAEPEGETAAGGGDSEKEDETSEKMEETSEAEEMAESGGEDEESGEEDSEESDSGAVSEEADEMEADVESEGEEDAENEEKE